MSRADIDWRLRYVSFASANQGYGAARNPGAEIARAVLLFLDDDILASAELVAEHASWQREHGDARGSRPKLHADRRQPRPALCQGPSSSITVQLAGVP